MILGVCLQIIDIDVWQSRQQKLQLLLVEDGNQSRSTNNNNQLIKVSRMIKLFLPSGNDIIETLQKSSELFPDGSSHFHLTNQLDVISLVVISHLTGESATH